MNRKNWLDYQHQLATMLLVAVPSSKPVASDRQRAQLQAMRWPDAARSLPDRESLRVVLPGIERRH
jgi:hypothetical protein